MELKTVGKFSSCISDVDFELLNTEFIVDLCFGFRKPNSCVGFAGLDLNSFGTTHCKLDLTQQFRLLIYLDLDLFGTCNPLWNKDKVYIRSLSVRLIFVTVFDFGPQHSLSQHS